MSSFSQSVALDTWNAPLATLSKTFRKNSYLFRSKTENFHTIILASEKILSLFLWTHRLQFWKSCFTVLLKVQVFFSPKSAIDRKTVFQCEFLPVFLLYARILVFWHTWLKKFAKQQRNCSISKNDTKNNKTFSKEKSFFLKLFLWKRCILL